VWRDVVLLERRKLGGRPDALKRRRRLAGAFVSFDDKAA
jgi:hypothetical protein